MIHQCGTFTTTISPQLPPVAPEVNLNMLHRKHCLAAFSQFHLDHPFFNDRFKMLVSATTDFATFATKDAF